MKKEKYSLAKPQSRKGEADKSIKSF